MFDEQMYKKIIETYQEELTEQHQFIIDGLLVLETAKDKDELSKILQELFRASHNIKGASKSVSLHEVADIAHQLEDNFSEWRDHHANPSEEDIDLCLKLADKILYVAKSHKFRQEDLGGIGEVSDKPKVIQGADVMRVGLAKINSANAKVDEFIALRLRLEGLPKLVDKQKIYYDESIHLQEKMKEQLGEQVAARSDIAAKYDNLNKMSSEWMKDFTFLKKELSAMSGEFNRSLQSLQLDLREMLLTPVSIVFEPLRRSARDLARSLKKEVSLVIEGGDIELDKSVLDILGDPLLHLMRNAIGHGIEMPQTREDNGKNKTGKLTISSQSESGKIFIKFKDDGAGIDAKKIKSLAMAKNLVDANALANMSDEELVELIFLPGFSTQSQVTELSGRGVGLDIVKESIERVNGAIAISSQLGVGTEFIISLPLTLATERGLYIRTGDSFFVLPSTSSSSILEVDLNDLVPVSGDKTYIINNRSIPVRDLAKVLDVKGNTDTVTSEKKLGILLESSKDAVLILVDEIMSEHECVIKPLGYPLYSVLNISGASLTEKGDLILVLNPQELVQSALQYVDNSSASTQTETQESASEDTLSNQAINSLPILVVDDSLTSRTLEASTLEAAGYRVETASNGEKAWALLKKKKYCLVVLDIEMPVMDGYALTELIKTDNKLNKVPVLIITAHESVEIKRRCNEVGANQFLVKNQFDTNCLVEAVEGLL
jgi:two-component system, chemotaxis family, sensor kinase CheA